MTSSDRPNILFIMADQLRSDYLGYNGADWMDTPNIDKLAARGMIFNHCYTSSPVCAPARISLASGLRPHRIGALDNQSFLPASTRTYYQRLRDHGYDVGCVGKLDLAKPDSYNGHGDRPCCFTWGFTHPVECEGKAHAGGSSTPRGPYTRHLKEKGLLERLNQDYRQRNYLTYRDSVLPTEDFEDIYIGRRSAQWLRERPKDFPFHLFVSFVGPHNPYDPPAEYADCYRERELPPRILDDGSGKPLRIQARMEGVKGQEEAKYTKLRRQYCASITAIDDAVGEVLQALEERGDADNTIIVFTSDHGDMLTDHNLPNKHVAYEPAWHVPLVFAGPGIQAGSTSNALTELMDIGETVCDLAGLSAPSHIDARSFTSVLSGATAAHRDFVLTQELGYRAIRDKQWKFIQTHNDKSELYDTLQDPNELCNLIDAHPDVAGDLKQKMVDGFAEGKWQRG
ncbi:MAG: sulfatase [Opitutales bacterium]